MESKKENSLKGTTINNLKKYIEEKLGKGSFLEGLQAVDLPTLILTSSWYPFEKYKRLCDHFSLELAMDESDFFRESTQYVLEESLNTVYKFFISLSGAQAVLKKLPQITTTFANFLYVEVVFNEKGKFVYRYQIPSIYFDWYLSGIEGAISGILSVCKQTLQKFEVKEQKEVQIDGQAYTAALIHITF